MCFFQQCGWTHGNWWSFDCCHIETFTIILWVNLISSCQEALEIRHAGMSRRYLIHSREAGKRCLIYLCPSFFCIAPGKFCDNEAMTAVWRLRYIYCRSNLAPELLCKEWLMIYSSPFHLLSKSSPDCLVRFPCYVGSLQWSWPLSFDLQLGTWPADSRAWSSTAGIFGSVRVPSKWESVQSRSQLKQGYTV